MISPMSGFSLKLPPMLGYLVVGVVIALLQALTAR